MGTLYVDTGGSVTNSGSTDSNTPDLTGSLAVATSIIVALDGTPDLSGVIITAGPTQSSIFLTSATNTNRKIFWIVSVDNVLKTITTDVTADAVAGSAWAIGGRFHLGPAGTPSNAAIEGALRSGDEGIINNAPATQTAAIWTFRIPGSSTAKFPKLRGAYGVTIPRLVSNYAGPTISLVTACCWVENLEVVNSSTNANANGISGAGTGCVVYTCKASDVGGTGFGGMGQGTRIINSEAVACSNGGILLNNVAAGAFGCYIHDITGDGISFSAANPTGYAVNNIIDTCTGRGIIVGGASNNLTHGLLIAGNTIYNNGNSGLEITNASTQITMFNNIFMNNGNAANEANVEWAAGTGETISFHAWNMFFNGSGADAPINFIIGAQASLTEVSADPLFVSAADGNFALSITSPARATGFPGAFIVSAPSRGYMDLGAVQVQSVTATAGTGGMLVHPGLAGGARG